MGNTVKSRPTRELDGVALFRNVLTISDTVARYEMTIDPLPQFETYARMVVLRSHLRECNLSMDDDVHDSMENIQASLAVLQRDHDTEATWHLNRKRLRCTVTPAMGALFVQLRKHVPKRLVWGNRVHQMRDAAPGGADDAGESFAVTVVPCVTEFGESCLMGWRVVPRGGDEDEDPRNQA